MTQRLPFTDTPRAPHLYRIWNQLREAKELPQVDRWLAQVFRGEKRFGKKDRQWYADAVFAALRLGPLLLLAEGVRGTGDWPQLRALPAERLFFWLSLTQVEGADERWTAEQAQLEAARRIPGVGQGLPLLYVPMLEQRVERSQWTAAERELFLTQQNSKAPLWLRLNHPGKAEQARRDLTAAGISWTENGHAWRLDSSKNLQSLPAIEQGILEIQDLASQEIGGICDVSGDPLIWDCCAGGGGKSMQLATRMKSGQVLASDVRSYKLDEVKRRAERAGITRIRTLPWDGETLPRFPRPLDAILIDAPCSGTGTWRRSPDSKYRYTQGSIADLQALQISIIRKVLPALKSGGQLIYATCSWLPQENEDVVAAALRDHPELSLETQKLCGTPAADADTMFYAVLRKK